MKVSNGISVTLTLEEVKDLLIAQIKSKHKRAIPADIKAEDVDMTVTFNDEGKAIETVSLKFPENAQDIKLEA